MFPKISKWSVRFSGWLVSEFVEFAASNTEIKDDGPETQRRTKADSSRNASLVPRPLLRSQISANSERGAGGGTLAASEGHDLCHELPGRL